MPPPDRARRSGVRLRDCFRPALRTFGAIGSASGAVCAQIIAGTQRQHGLPHAGSAALVALARDLDVPVTACLVGKMRHDADLVSRALRNPGDFLVRDGLELLVVDELPCPGGLPECVRFAHGSGVQFIDNSCHDCDLQTLGLVTRFEPTIIGITINNDSVAVCYLFYYLRPAAAKSCALSRLSRLRCKSLTDTSLRNSTCLPRLTMVRTVSACA